MKNSLLKNSRKYIYEFFLIFISVLAAFALTEWNDNKSAQISQEKLLSEIKNGINLDLQDFEHNVQGNLLSIDAGNIFRALIQKQGVSQDSINFYYLALFRDYTPIINKTGYESLKATSLKTITNDSLRFQIIKLYDYYYKIIEKLEDEVPEMRSYNYYAPINTILSSYMLFDQQGNFKSFETPINISPQAQKEILSYLWRIEQNRRFKISRYNTVIEAIKKLDISVQKELDK